MSPFKFFNSELHGRFFTRLTRNVGFSYYQKLLPLKTPVKFSLLLSLNSIYNLVWSWWSQLLTTWIWCGACPKLMINKCSSLILIKNGKVIKFLDSTKSYLCVSKVILSAPGIMMLNLVCLSPYLRCCFDE